MELRISESELRRLALKNQRFVVFELKGVIVPIKIVIFIYLLGWLLHSLRNSFYSVICKYPITVSYSADLIVLIVYNNFR